MSVERITLNDKGAVASLNGSNDKGAVASLNGSLSPPQVPFTAILYVKSN